MDDALNLLYMIYSKFIIWIFNAYLFPGVSIGTLIVVCGLFNIIIFGLVKAQRGSSSFERDYRMGRESVYESRTDIISKGKGFTHTRTSSRRIR